MVILTDLSEVLINGVTKVGEVIAERYGEEYGARYNERFEQSREDFHDLLRDRISEYTFFDILMNDEYWPFEPGHLEWIYTDEFRKEIPGTLDVYERIAAYPQSFTNPTMKNGIPKFYVVSDHIADHTREIEYHHVDIFRLAWDPIWSCDLGMIKRDPEFFPKVLEMLELKPEECLFIDDTIENIKAAEAVGIKSIHFQDANQLEEDLAALGFKF